MRTTERAIPEAAAQDSGTQRGRLAAAVATPAAVVGGLLFLVLLPVCHRLPWVGDLGLHLAVADRAAADPLHPVDPLVHSTASSPYYSPWTIAQGLLIRGTGASNHAVLGL